jgi:hypothetical protein
LQGLLLERARKQVRFPRAAYVVAMACRDAHGDRVGRRGPPDPPGWAELDLPDPDGPNAREDRTEETTLRS